MNPITYIKNFIKDYRIGAITRSSKFVVKSVMEHIPAKTRYIVEYGAGDGVLTKALLEYIGREGKVVAIETNPEFQRILERLKNRHLVIAPADVRTISHDLTALGVPRVDVVISSIPLTFFSPEDRETLVKNTHASLAPNGTFIVYQYSTLMMPVLKKYFSEVSVHLEALNTPPYFIMVAKKGCEEDVDE